MKKQMLTGILIIGMSFTAYAGQWESDSAGYWYEEENGVYPSDTWKMIDGKWYHFNGQGYMDSNTWIGDFYVGSDGAMWTNTLIREGYWLDENGRKDENKRIYGDCVFNPTAYKKEGDRYEITGMICDTGYMAQEEIDRMSVGAVVKIPDIYQFDRVCEFTEEAYASEFQADFHNGKRTIVVRKPYYYQDLDGMQTGVFEYTLNSQGMSGWCTDSMDWPVYRVVQKNVTLIADSATEFIAENGVPETSLEECLKSWVDFSIANYGKSDGSKILTITLTGNHIDQAVDPLSNYSG